MGIGKFHLPPPQNRYPWIDQQKSRHSWLRPREDPFTEFGTNPPTGGFWANGWNITITYFLFIPFFLRFAYRSDGDPWMDFYAWQLKRRETMQGCAFWGSEWCAPKFWGKTPKNWILGAWIGLSSLNDKKIQILITWKLLSRSQRNFYREYAPRMRLCGWSHGSPTNPRWQRPPSVILEKCQ